MGVNTVVLAGGDGSAIDASVGPKGSVLVAGRPMAEWVVDTLLNCSSVDRISIVTPDASAFAALADGRVAVVESNQRFIDNMLAGIDSFGEKRPTLIATADIPALTVQAIDDFVGRALDARADFAYPLISETDMLEQFPGSVRTFVRIDEGRVTGGNVALLSPDLVARNRDIGQRLFETRKSPLAMAGVVGLPFIVRLITGRLRVADVERRMESLLGGRCLAVVTRHACLGADIDKPVDLSVVEGLLSPSTTG